MDIPETRLSRISKLFIDRDEATAEAALARRQRHAVTLCCGSDVEESYTLQLAVLTAANIANRCFPGAVRIALEHKLVEAPLLVWPSLKQKFGQAIVGLLGPDALTELSNHEHDHHMVLFGNAVPTKGALRATFDGWIAMVGPADEASRLPEREYCSLAGILAASLAISELFLSFAEISIDASRRTVALSLWQPAAVVRDPAALGIPVQFLPGDLWIMGLGHLGNAYLWSLSTLPYQDPGAVEIFLNDFDRIELANLETGLLFNPDNLHPRYKTRVCSEWLEKRGFQTRLVERRFDSHFRCRADEPKLALCGFDSNPARRDLSTAEFLRVIESGLGGTANNFDTISLHTLPNARTAEELWPDLTAHEDAKRIADQERTAQQNAAYARLAHDECGRYELAGKSVAVPFVGATAASLVVAESIRLLHSGPAYTEIKITLSALGTRVAQSTGNYGNQDFAGLKYCDCRVPHP
ncbi:MAG: hypothetical protein ABSH35_23970 [Isosphaeraceae bacterium]|jgi:hypothetical protein